MEKIELIALKRVLKCIDRNKLDEFYNMIVEETIEMNQKSRLELLQKVNESLSCIYQSGLFERGFNREITDKTAKILAEEIDIKLKNK